MPSHPNEGLVWNPTLSVEDSDLDEEHRAIIEKMNEVERANSRTMSKEILLEKYDELVSVTEKHFADEEIYMREMKYHDLSTHHRIHRIHQQLFEALERYREELQKSVYGRFPSSVFDFFRTWLTTHIMIVDQQYVKFKNSK